MLPHPMIPGRALRPVALCAAISLLGPGAAQARQAAPAAPPEVVTSGSGQVVLSPDRAVLRIGVGTRAATASAASTINGPPVQRVRDTLAALGFRDQAVRAISFGVAPRYDYQAGQRLIDYEARTTLEITLMEIPVLGRILDAVLSAGATEIASIVFESDSTPAARRRALAMALTGAREDAEVLARAAGGRLGALRLVTTSPQYEDYGGIAMRTAAEMSAPAPGVPPVRRDVVVRVAVQARWAFVPVP